MSYIQWTMFSKFLNGRTDIDIILPEYREDEADPANYFCNTPKRKVLWMLHGTTGDRRDWTHMSNIELYAMENDLAVVMPSALNSNYTSWPDFGRGYDFPNFFFQELMPMVYHWLPVSDRREDNFIAGDSMGGNGAFIFAVSHPELFAGAGIFSSCARNYDCQVEDGSLATDPKMGGTVRNMGGVERFMASDINIRGRLRDLAAANELSRLPSFYVVYGDQDPRMTMMRDFLDFCGTIDLKVDAEVIPGYAHEWRLWDLALQRALKRWGIQKQAIDFGDEIADKL